MKTDGIKVFGHIFCNSSLCNFFRRTGHVHASIKLHIKFHNALPLSYQAAWELINKLCVIWHHFPLEMNKCIIYDKS